MNNFEYTIRLVLRLKQFIREGGKESEIDEVSDLLDIPFGWTSNPDPSKILTPDERRVMQSVLRLLDT